MNVRELIDCLLDYANTSDEVIIVNGKEADFENELCMECLEREQE